MGMDVFGLAPTDEIGAYFRNNVWWWHPLWSYCESLAPDLIPEDNEGQFNSGWGLNSEGAKALAARLRAELTSGRCAAEAKRYQAELAALVNEPCKLCHGTGIRTDKVGMEQGMPTKPNPHRDGLGWCNGCDGKGSVRPIASHYPFSAENVADFANFLESCGGFAIR